MIMKTKLGRGGGGAFKSNFTLKIRGKVKKELKFNSNNNNGRCSIILLEDPRWFDWLVLQSLQDVTGAEFKMFMDFLISLSIFGEKAPPERVQELIEIIEGQADLDAQFSVSTSSFNLASLMFSLVNPLILLFLNVILLTIIS